MGNVAAMSRFRPQLPVARPELTKMQPGMASPGFEKMQPGMTNPGLISQIVANPGIKATQPNFGAVVGDISRAVGRGRVPPKKPNLQKAQRMNPPEVPTRRLY